MYDDKSVFVGPYLFIFIGVKGDIADHNHSSMFLQEFLCRYVRSVLNVRKGRGTLTNIEMLSDLQNSVAEMVTSLYILHLCYY